MAAGFVFPAADGEGVQNACALPRGPASLEWHSSKINPSLSNE